METKDVKAENLKGVYKEIANHFGVEIAEKIHSVFRGQQITFPVQFYDPDYISQLIVSEYNGHNVRALAAKYGYSEKWIRVIIRKNRNR